MMKTAGQSVRTIACRTAYLLCLPVSWPGTVCATDLSEDILQSNPKEKSY
jgi:hypothetical protein